MTIEIELQKVTKRFGKEVIAVNQLDLKINKGEVFCLVGPNAAGKTTTIKLLLGILKADEGNIRVKGLKIPGDKKKLRRILGYLPQRRALYDLLTARENIEFFARAKGLSKKKVKEKLISLGFRSDSIE